MKRIQSSAIFQTLCFSQKPELNLTRDQALAVNKEEVDRYIRTLERTKTRYRIMDRQEQSDGSIILRVRKQYNPTISVDEYFNL